MNIFSLYAMGIRQGVRTARLAILLYSVTFLLALPAAYAFRTMLSAGFGDSAVPLDFLEPFTFILTSDFLRLHGAAFQTVISLLVPTAVLAFCVFPLLTGGVLATLRESDPSFSFRKFVRLAGHYYGRMFRLSLLVLVAGLLCGAVLGLFMILAVSVVRESSYSEIPVFVTFVIGVGLIVFSFGLLLLAADYARISLVAGDRDRILAAGVNGAGFVLRNFRGACSLGLLFLITLIVITAGYWLLTEVIPEEFFLRASILILLQQALVLSRTFLRVSSYSAETILFEERKPVSVLFYGWDDSSPHPVR